MGTYKFGFQKEWYHFSRTFRFGGVLIALFSIAVANPLMIKAMEVLYSAAADSMSAMGSMAGMEELLAIQYTSGTVFGAALADLCNTSLLVILLLLMSPFGGEQKKRATLIPSCSGLDTKYYLVPKFVLYTVLIFISCFVAGLCAGGISNALFEGTVSAGDMLLGSLLCAIYQAFVLNIYMALGLCTSRPGTMTVLVYFGHSIVNSILQAMELGRFNPFTLHNVFAYQLYDEQFSLSAEAASIVVGIVLSAVISVVMYFLALTVLNNKRINNAAEDKPEF